MMGRDFSNQVHRSFAKNARMAMHSSAKPSGGFFDED